MILIFTLIRVKCQVIISTFYFYNPLWYVLNILYPRYISQQLLLKLKVLLYVQDIEVNIIYKCEIKNVITDILCTALTDTPSRQIPVVLCQVSISCRLYNIPEYPLPYYDGNKLEFIESHIMDVFTKFYNDFIVIQATDTYSNVCQLTVDCDVSLYLQRALRHLECK